MGRALLWGATCVEILTTFHVPATVIKSGSAAALAEVPSGSNIHI